VPKSYFSLVGDFFTGITHAKFALLVLSDIHLWFKTNSPIG